MTNRQRYMADLRLQLTELLGEERQQVSLAGLERELANGFPHALPGRVTLSKALTGLGWHRIPRPGSGAVYARGGRD